MNIYGVPKPAYRAYELLHRLGDEIFESVKIPVESDHNVDAWLTRRGSKLIVLMTNSALPRHAVSTEEVEIKMTNINAALSAYVERIDDDHANATQAWYAMGRPESLKPHEVQALELASSLVKESIAVVAADGGITFKIVLPPQGTACVTLEIKN